MTQRSVLRRKHDSVSLDNYDWKECCRYSQSSGYLLASEARWLELSRAKVTHAPMPTNMPSKIATGTSIALYEVLARKGDAACFAACAASFSASFSATAASSA